MEDTDERWRAAVIDVGADADAALVSSQRPTECDCQERRLCPSSCTDDIASWHIGGSGEMGHVEECCVLEDIKNDGSISAEEMKPELEPEQGANCNEEPKCGEKVVEIETKSELELKPKPRNSWETELTWEEKVLEALNVVRRWEITEFDPKWGWFVPTRLSTFNIAFFDLDKESNLGLGPPILSQNFNDEYYMLEASLNVISIKVVESDVGYPVSIFGTVLARDQNDYRCVYLFRRGRDDPQIITSPEDMLTLTGPK